MSLYNRALRIVSEHRGEWLGKDGVYSVYADTQESDVFVLYKGDERPEWLPREIEGVAVVALWMGAA